MMTLEELRKDLNRITADVKVNGEKLKVISRKVEGSGTITLMSGNLKSDRSISISEIVRRIEEIEKRLTELEA
jgi:hypothetical protein